MWHSLITRWYTLTYPAHSQIDPLHALAKLSYSLQEMCSRQYDDLAVTLRNRIACSAQVIGQGDGSFSALPSVTSSLCKKPKKDIERLSGHCLTW